MFQFASQAQPFWLIIKDSFRLWWASISKWWYIIMPLIILGSLPFIWVGLYTSQTTSLASQVQGLIPALIFFYFIVIFAFSLFITIATRFFAKQPHSFLENITHSLARYLACWLTFILYGLCILFGFIFLIIPGFAFAIYLSVAMPLVVSENLGPIKALQKSFHLVLGHWWHVFLVNLGILGFVYSCLFLSFSLFDSLLIRNIFATTLSAIFLPLLWSTLLVLIRDLELRKPLEPKPIGAS